MFPSKAHVLSGVIVLARPEQMSRKVALVTGGSSGIGRASALEFAKQGFTHVVVADVDQAGGEETCRLVQEIVGAAAMYIPTDVSKEGDVRHLIEVIHRDCGRLDCCHNNAGIEGDRAPTHQYSTESFDRVMSVNVRGVWLCMKYEVPLMLETAGNKGSIVISSSTAGLQGMPEFGPYSASKHALVGLARSAAGEYAGRIRVNCVNPATTDTPMVARFADKWPEWQAATNASYPMGRIATAAEVAEAVVWVALRAKFMTGQTVVLDGGSMCS